MSIEGGAGATSPKTTVAGSENHGVKARAKSGGDANAPAGGGFLALLTSLEPPTAVGAPGNATDAQPQAADTQVPASDSSLLLPQNLPQAVALLLAQAGEVGAAAPDADMEVLLDHPGLLVRPPKGGGTASRSLGVGLGAPIGKTDQSELTLTAAASGADMAADAAQNVEALLDQSTPSWLARAPKGGSTGSQLGAGASLAQANTPSLSTLGENAARDPALSGALVSSGIGDSFLRQTERAAPKSSGASGTEGVWGHQALLAASRADAPSAMANPATLSLESTVAETVSYWVTQGVQNAALKLDGLGGEPVEVNISLKGREAHIGFRTDQPEIRQLLEGALAHLKDLLANEGLVLSGVSVGTSGQDGKGTPERRFRPVVQQVSVLASEGLPGESHPRVSKSTGRAVDVFV